MFSNRLLISKSSNPIINPSVTVPRAPVTIGINVTFMFHSFFFQFPSKVEVHILPFTFFQYDSKLSRDINSELLLLLFTPLEYFTSVLAAGLSLEFEWLQVSRTLLSIQAGLNNMVVWMVSTRPPISKSTSLFINSLMTVTNIIIIIWLRASFQLQR